MAGVRRHQQQPRDHGRPGQYRRQPLPYAQWRPSRRRDPLLRSQQRHLGDLVDRRALSPWAMDPPVVGRFVDGVGTFYSDGTVNGRPARTRFIWSEITPTSARWEQALSTTREDLAGQLDHDVPARLRIAGRRRRSLPNPSTRASEQGDAEPALLDGRTVEPAVMRAQATIPARQYPRRMSPTEVSA